MLREIYRLGSFLFRSHLGIVGSMASMGRLSSLSLGYRAENALASRRTSEPTQGMPRNIPGSVAIGSAPSRELSIRARSTPRRRRSFPPSSDLWLPAYHEASLPGSVEDETPGRPCGTGPHHAPWGRAVTATLYDATMGCGGFWICRRRPYTRPA